MRARGKNGRFESNPLKIGGFFKCISCGVEKEANTENFRIINKGRDCESLSKTCRKCCSKIGKVNYEKRKADPEYRKSRLERTKAWRNKNKARVALNNYKSIDARKGLECTMTVDDIAELQSMPCHYCGDTERIGADRINNELAHTKENCFPCCPDCNMCKSNKFSVDEMVVIGAAIRIVKKSRK